MLRPHGMHRRDVLLSATAWLAAGPAWAAPNVRDVAFRDLKGRIVTPREFLGRAVVMHVFTSWDLPSLRSVPELRALATERTRDVAVVGVGMDMEGALAMSSFEKTLKPGYPLWMPETAFRQGNTPFGPVRSVPALFILGRDGSLREGYAGYVPLKDLLPMVDRAAR